MRAVACNAPVKVGCSLVSGSYYGTTRFWTWKDPEWSPTFRLTSWVSLGSLHYPSICSFLSCAVGKNLYSSTVPWDLFHTCTDRYSRATSHTWPLSTGTWLVTEKQYLSFLFLQWIQRYVAICSSWLLFIV